MECSICHKTFKQKNLLVKHLKLKKPCKIDGYKTIVEKLNEVKTEEQADKQKQLNEIMNAPVELTPRQLYDKQRYVPVKNVVRKTYQKKNEVVLIYDRGIAPIWVDEKILSKQPYSTRKTRTNREKRINIMNRNADYDVSAKLIAKKVPELQSKKETI
jgi:hypothetical protein